MPKIAILQMTSGIDPEVNLAAISKAVEEASAKGAQILFTPEMAPIIDRDRKRLRRWVASEKPFDVQYHLFELAGSFGIDIVIGSMPDVVLSPRPDYSEWGKCANRSYYLKRERSEAGYYDKIHMFDVELTTGETWRESSVYEPGREVVTVENTPLGRLGLTICYDMRFPALFEALGQQKCDAIAVPAAFTKPTGEAHWHVLLRARAIEAQAFVIAAAQVGKHEDGRETYGHSLVVDPWGEVLLDMGGEAPGLAFCDIDLERIEEVRRQLPSLANRRAIHN